MAWQNSRRRIVFLAYIIPHSLVFSRQNIERFFTNSLLSWSWKSQSSFVNHSRIAPLVCRFQFARLVLCLSVPAFRLPSFFSLLRSSPTFYRCFMRSALPIFPLSPCLCNESLSLSPFHSLTDPFREQKEAFWDRSHHMGAGYIEWFWL